MADTLASLAADLAKAAAAIVPASRGVVQSAGKPMVEAWRSVPPWSGSEHLPHLGKAVTYETRSYAAGAMVEAGPRKGGQGNLGHLIEFGSVNNGPHPGGPSALAAGVPIVEAGLAAAASALLLGGFRLSTASSNPGRFNS